MNAILPFNREISEKIGRKIVILVGSIMIPVIALMCSYTTSIIFFSVMYGIGIGSVLGVSLPLPQMMVYEYFPHKKGLAFGILSIGIGIGTLPLNYIF